MVRCPEETLVGVTVRCSLGGGLFVWSRRLLPTNTADMSQLIGNALLLLTYLRIVVGISILSQNIFWGFGAVIPVLFLVAYWEKKSPSQGRRRLARGAIVFLATIAVDVIAYALF